MDYRRLKKRAIIGVVALTLALGVQPAGAQTATTVGATFTTAAASISATGTVMDFGVWVVDIQRDETITLPLLPALTLPPPVPIVGSAVISVMAPAATTLEIKGNVTSDFANPGLSLGSLTYTDTVVAGAVIPTVYDGTVVTIIKAGVVETVAIGGTLSLSGTTLAAGKTFSDAVATIDLRY